MSGKKRLTERNAAIAEMLSDGEQVKNFYRFIAQNPHIPLHDACQIVVVRPNASVCFSFNEWNAMGRRVTKGRSGIAYYDYDGYKQFVFDANDTHGDNRYQRPIFPMKRLLAGLDALNGMDLSADGSSDWRKIRKGVHLYLRAQDQLTGDDIRDGLLAEGIAYSLYAKTGFPQSMDIHLSGLPYSYKENADLVKEIYIQTDELLQEIEDTYYRKQNEVKVIDDTEEETVSDEPIIISASVEQTDEKPEQAEEIIPVEQTGEEEIVEQTEEQPTVTPYYQKYLDAQKLNPQAVVVMRLGDFYEILGENAKTVSAELELTLTGRNVGLPERVPMCGMPYHAMDRYLDKILAKHSVLLVDGEEEPKYILSHIEALRQSHTLHDAEEFLHDGEELAELEELYSESVLDKPEEQPERLDEESKPRITRLRLEVLDDDEPNPFDVKQSDMGASDSELSGQAEETDGYDYKSDEYSDEDEEILQEQDEDYDEEESEQPKEKVKSTPKKSEQGIKDRKRKQPPQVNLFDILEPQEKSKEEQLIEYELKRGSHIEHGKFRVFDKYNENPSVKAFAEFLKKEYGDGGSYVGNTKETHNAKGIRLKWVEKEHPENNLDILLKWPNVAVRIADLIDDDNYFTEQEKKEYVEYRTEQNRLRELRAEEERQRKLFLEKVVLDEPDDRKERIKATYYKTDGQKEFTEFVKNEYGAYTTKELDGKRAVINDFGVFVSEYNASGNTENKYLVEWEAVVEKITALIDSDKYLSSEPQEELRDLDAEEDEDWDVLIDAGILKPVESTPKTEKPVFNRFKELSAEGKAFFDKYQQRYVREPANSLWDEVESCRVIANGIYEVSTAGHGGIMIAEELAPYILSPEALQKGVKDGGYYCFEEDCDACIPLRELYDKGILIQTNEHFTCRRVRAEDPQIGFIPFDEATEVEKATFFEEWNGLINRSLESWNPEYWEARRQVEVHEEETSDENTDLTNVLDQSELGGAKARFKGNVAAIRLVNKLYSENRNPTQEEKKILSQFVGWGGLSQAFDENNKQWRREYNELKGLLSQEDYEQARSSTLNAYYTAKDVIGGIYSALARFGVKGNNRILEPSMGTGNFFGFMPQTIADGSRLYGVELDNLTGRIAAKLYPQANVQIKGFEDTSFPNDRFDIVVGNVPFGGYGVADSDYNRYNFRVHDYFLAKSVDKVKPNGIVAIVTSKGTMDKLNPSARKYVAERAELLGAIRLPNTAFKQTAGTEAVADILFFRKREEKISDVSEAEWVSTGKTEEGYEINQYFITHPEMVLGKLTKAVGLYGGEDITVEPNGRELSEAIGEAVKNLPQDFYTVPETSPQEESAIEVDYNVKPLCYKADSGRLYMRIGDEMEEQAIPKTPKDAYQRIQGMIALREELHHILDIQIQGCSDETLQEEQRKLNAQYDLFVRKYGNLNSQTNTRLFKEDGDSALLFASEVVDKETGAVSKADVFTKRTIRPYIVPTSTADPFEALQISKNERGRVDISYIEELTGKSYDDVLFELGDAVFRNPETTDRTNKYSGFATSEEYLSGKVVAKLNTARRYAEQFPEYQRNVEALEKVQPTPLTASEISVRLGQTWIDKEIYKQFYMNLVGVDWWRRGDVELFYNPHDSSWRLDQKDSVRNYTQMKQKEVYGTSRAPAYRLFIDCMNLKATTIYDTVQDEDGKERRVLNQAETIAAREKQNKIKEEFANWIFANPERREELEATYNRLFNQIRLPKYDGSYLKFPEMNPAIELRPHQKDAIHRILTNNQSTLLHHVVGSGKTYTMAASIMKMRQLGLCKKAMVAVPNHLVQQWASEWRKLYPNAKILVATKEDLEKNNRQKFVSKVALGDWDGIIIAQSSFAKIPVSTERQIRKLNEEIASVEETIRYQWETNGIPRGAVKNLEQIKKTKQAQLKKLMDDKKKDSVLIFENLGVDCLYIDEAHYYKNLFLFTKMNNVAGISNAASQRASDLKLKCEYLQELHGCDRGVVFATGTPISNSMTEMYTMQSYLQPSMLKEIGIEFFDGWAADFGETVTSMELAPSGKGYQARTRFAKFTNLPELQTMYRSFADVITSDMVQLDVPEAEKHVINLKPSDTVIELAERIAERAEIIHDGGVTPEIDNMLKVTSDGKKLALDPRCFVPDSEDEEVSKLNEAAQRIYEIWEDTSDIKGTQIVFCDLSTPKVRSEEYIYGLRFDAYNDLKYKLVQRGIPAEEVAFIHDAKTDEQKQALFDKVNSGAVRVLIGSTEKCGAGTNVQKRLVALHHLDTPYRPSDMEQREGRIIRQGNTNEKVDIYTYVTERTFDSYSYQILENKSRFIQQIARGDFTAREFEDIDETTLSYAEIKAITAANPKIKRKMEVDAEIARLRVLEGQYKKNLYHLQDKIRKDFPEDIRKHELLIERVTLDLMHLQASKPADPEAFEINVNGKLYTDRKEGGKALTDALYASRTDTVIAEYCGFKISMNPMTSLTGERDITLTANGQYVIGIGESSSGNLTRLDNFLEDFLKRKERLENRLMQLKSDLEIAKEQVEKPFEHKERLSELLSEQTELNTELNLDKREESVVIDDGNDSDGEHYMALPEQRKNMEEEIIDKEDKVAAMQVDVLPDYTVTQEDMHKYGYTWDGMLPLTRTMALKFWGMGLEIHKLFPNDTEITVEHYGDLNPHELNLYGIEKPVWKNFLENKKSVPYLMARLYIASAAWNMVSEEMRDVEGRFKDKFMDGCFSERAALEDYLPYKKPPEKNEIEGYLPRILDEFTERLWHDELNYYGWTETDVYKSIADHIADEELKAYIKQTLTPFNAEKELMIILGGKTEEEIKDMDLPAFDDELTVLAKEQDRLLTDKTYMPGLLLLRNEEIDEWYVINDTSARGKDGQPLAVGDKTDVMTVLAYNGLHDGNPLRKFYSEAEARAYFNEKAGVQEKVQSSSTVNESRDTFLYNGYHFKAVGVLTDERELKDITQDLVSDVELGMTKYEDRRKQDYSYEGFYKSSGGSAADIFYCVETKKNYIPGENELFEYIGKYTPYVKAEVNDEEKGTEMGQEKVEKIDYEKEAINSVNAEFEAFKTETLQKSSEDIFHENYKINIFTELKDVIETGSDSGYLSKKYYKALYEERGHILHSLYDDFIGDEFASVNSGTDTAEFIKSYCEHYHADVMYPTVYYGKDTENTSYYQFQRALSFDTLPEITEQADSFVVAAPNSFISKDDLEKKNIFFLKIGRDISEDELADKDKAIGNMQTAVDKVIKARHKEYLDRLNYYTQCKGAIEEAIRGNFDGMHLKDNFDGLLAKYSIDDINYVLANTVQYYHSDGRISRENKAWANETEITQNEGHRYQFVLNTHLAVLDGFIDIIRRKEKEYKNKAENMDGSEVPKELSNIINNEKVEETNKMAQDKYLHFTARGDKVLSIVKDRDDRNIAIIRREKMNDFVVAARYDTADGRWAQGTYDFKTLEAAEKYRTEKYGFENTSDTVEKKWLTCKVSPEALIKKYQFNSRFMMPKGSGYEGYAYSIFNDRIKEGTITTDLKSDTRERALVLSIPTNKKVEISGNGKTVELDPHEFISLVNETTSDKYEREQRYTVGFPPEAFIKDYDTSMLVAMPNDTKYKGYVYYLPKSVISEDKYSDNGTLIANIGESFKVTLRKGEEKVELTAKEYLELVGDKKADYYKREPTEMDEYREQQGEDDKKWNTVSISENAVIANYENNTLFKMPKGDYAGFVYYVPSGMVRKEDDGLYLRVPEDFIAHLKNGDEKHDLTVQEFITEIEGKTDEDYKGVYRRPSEEAVKQFEKVEQQLRRNVPEEMLNKPNWVAVRTRKKDDTGRLDKFLINPHTGEFAQSDNPETWADFDTACRYAKENGGVCLAYALDGKDNIACIDLDDCMGENGDFSPLAVKAFKACEGSYAEKSVSGKGLHIFGKTKGSDLRSCSKEKDMEYYQDGHFIAMTGDYYGSSQLKDFDSSPIKNLLESKLERREEWKNTGKGIEGLSSMDDREMLEKAFAAKNGDIVKRLYNGEDVRHNHSDSDMSLMNYLAFWSNHDIDQMLRVFATSGLYRPEKSQSYYEHTAIKAVKGTPVYTPPKVINNAPKAESGSNGKR